MGRHMQVGWVKIVYQLNRPIHHGSCRRHGDQNKHTCQVTGITELVKA